MNLALQLYSLREVFPADVAGTMKKVAEMGYKEVEFAGYYGLGSAEMKKLLDDCGLKAVSTHVGTDAIRNRLKEEIEFNLAVGNKNIVLASTPMENPEQVKQAAELLSQAAETAAGYGVTIGYHNHGYEFERTENGVRYIDLLAKYSSQKVNFQFDVYWVTYGGADPMEYVAKYAGRECLMHLKELAKDEPKRNVEIGSGKIDFASLIQLGKKIGIEHFIVEQEAYTLPALESCKASFEGVRRLGVL